MSRNIKPIIVLTVIFTISVFNVSFADSDYQVGTRGEGIGFAFSTAADEPFGALYNPAGPAFMEGYQAQVGYQIPTEYGLSIVDESPYGAMMGVNYNAPSMGTVTFSTHRYGSFTDPTAVPTTNTTNLSFARPFGPLLAVGVGLKYIFESDFEKRSAFDLDLGVKFKATENFHFAGVLENASRAEYSSDLLSSHLDRKVRLAASYNMPMGDNIGSLFLGTQLSQNQGEDVEFTNLVNVGSEVWFAAYSDISLGVRGGYTFGKVEQFLNTEEDYSRWSAGFSLNFNMQGNDLRVDYAIRSYPFESNESITTDQFVTVSYGWGGVPDYFAGRETEKDDKYDLTKYQKSQDWQTPQEVVEAREPEPVVETKPVEAEIEKTEKPVEIVKQPDPVTPPVVNTPVGLPQQIEEKPAVKPDQPVPVSLTIIETPPAQSEPVEPIIAEPVPPVSIAQPKTEAPIVVEDSDAPGELKIVDNQLVAEDNPRIQIVAELDQPVPESKPLDAPDVGQPAPVAITPEVSTPPVEPLTIAQVPEEPSKKHMVQKPKRAPAPEKIEYQKLDLTLDVNQMVGIGTSKVVFTLRPNSIRHLKSWKLYVFAKKPKKWNEAVIDDYALAVIKGRGVTPLSVIWDGTLERGGQVTKGKYVFVVIGKDSQGNHLMSKWHKFKIK